MRSHIWDLAKVCSIPEGVLGSSWFTLEVALGKILVLECQKRTVNLIFENGIGYMSCVYEITYMRLHIWDRVYELRI